MRNNDEIDDWHHRRDEIIDDLFNYFSDSDLKEILNEIKIITTSTGFGIIQIEFRAGIPFAHGGLCWSRCKKTLTK